MNSTVLKLCSAFLLFGIGMAIAIGLLSGFFLK